MEKTDRGFDYTEFKDDYGNDCSLQKSSSAMVDRVWFGVNDVNPQIMASDAIRMGLPSTGQTNGWVPFEVPKEVMFSDRMHLSQETLHGLMPHLEEFVDTGDLEDGYDYDFEKGYALDLFSDDYELVDFENMMEDLENSVNMIVETIGRIEKRREKLVKYLTGIKVAATNLQILIDKEKQKEELAIVKYIKSNGLDNAINTFKLKCKDYGHKILLKYNQLESDSSFQEVRECRGLILEKNTWKVMSLAFTRFFNSAEGHASKIDWDTAYIFEKCDGSLIQVYWDWVAEKWCAGTSGMAEGEGEVNDKPNTKFSELFWDTIASSNYSFNWDRMVKGRTYMFELMTPYNIVVKPHGFSQVVLLGVRELEILKEYNFNDLHTISSDIGLPLVKVFDMNMSNAGQLMKTFEGMPFSEEGYVVCDAYFNRIKLKNPAYVAAHHLKSKTGLHHILTIVKSNEVEEYGATFPERLDEINDLKLKYDALIINLEGVWDELKEFKPKNITKPEQKKFAMKVFEIIEKYDVKPFSGMFFALKDRKTESVKDFIFEYSDKNLYEMFIK